MKREEILKAIESGEYEIRTDSACDCMVTRIDEYGQIDCEGNECWYAKALYINDEIIAEYVQFDGLTMHTDEISGEDIYDNDDLYTAIRIRDTDENPSHDMERILLDYFEEYPDAKFYRDNARGFANEYEIIIDLEGAADDDDINDDWDVLTAEEAASEIAYDGDASTQAYNSVKVL